MRSFNLAALTLLLLTAASFAADPAADKPQSIPVADLKRTEPVDFQKDILPIFKRSCTACHNQADAKGDLILESPQTIAKGGESGVVAVAGKGAESLLLKAAAHQAKPFMPPKNNKVGAKPLTSDELGLLKLWIDQGAKGDVVITTPKVEWQPLPPGLNPVYAIAMSPDGQYVAAGRANQIFIYHVPTKSLVTRLTDDSLIKSGLFKQPGNAHRDLVQSLAFSPDGSLLASGGYRVVKLWPRPGAERAADLALGAAAKAAAVSPDGKWLAVAAGNEVKLFNLTDGKPGPALQGHGGAVNDVKFSADGAKLVTASADKTARWWTTADGKQAGKIETPEEVTAVAFVAKDAKIVTGHKDNLLRVWAVADITKPAHEIKQHTGPITALVAVPGAGLENEFISASADGSARQFNADTGKPGKLVMTHGSPVTALAISPDGKVLATLGGPVGKLWKMDKGAAAGELKGLPGMNDRIERATQLAGLADQHVAYYKKFVTDSEARKKSETENLAKAKEALTKTVEEHKKAEEAFKKAEVAMAAPAKMIAEADAALKKATDEKAAAEAMLAAVDKDLKPLMEKFGPQAAAYNAAKKAHDDAKAAADARTPKTKASADAVEAAKKALAAKPDDKALQDAVKAAETALAGRLATQKTADDAVAAAKAELDKVAAANAEFTKAKEPLEAKRDVAAKAKAAADKAFADATEAKKKAEQSAGGVKKPFEDAQKAFETVARLKDAQMNAVQSGEASLKKSEETLAQGQADQKQAEDDAKKAAAAVEEAKKAAAEPGKPFISVAFSPDSKMVITGNDAGLVQTWNADDASPLSVIAGKAAAAAVAATPAGHIISAGADQKAVVWSTAGDWKLAGAIGNGESDSPLIDRVLALDFSRDGKMLATGGGQPSRSGELKIWNVADGALLREIKDAHSDTVFSVEFTYDGKRLASCAADKFVKTWNVADGKFLMSFEGHTHHALGVSWMADGRTLASAGADSVVKVWDFVQGGQKKTVQGYGKEVAAIKFVGIADAAITISGDGAIKAINQAGNSVKTFTSASDYLYCLSVTPDGKFFAVSGLDSIVRVFTYAGAEVAKFEPPVPQTAQK